MPLDGLAPQDPVQDEALSSLRDAPAFRASEFRGGRPVDREQAVDFFSAMVQGLSPEIIKRDPDEALVLIRSTWDQLSSRERDAARGIYAQALMRVDAVRRSQMSPRAAEALAIQQSQGLLGDVASGAGEVVGGVAAGVPNALVFNPLEMVGLGGLASAGRKLLYGDDVDTATAQRRIRDIFRAGVGALTGDSRMAGLLKGGPEDMTQLLGQALEADVAGRSIGLPGQGAVETLGQPEIDPVTGSAMAPRTGIEETGSFAGYMGSVILGNKAMMGVAGQTLGRTSIGQRISAGMQQSLAGRMGLEGAANVAYGGLERKSLANAPEDFLLGAGMRGAGELIGAGGKALAEGGAPGSMRQQIGVGLQGGTRHAFEPEFRAGARGALARTLSRAGAETAKVSAGTFASELYRSAKDGKGLYTPIEAFVRTMEQLPGALAFGAFGAVAGNRDVRAPGEAAGKGPTEAELSAYRREKLRAFLRGGEPSQAGEQIVGELKDLGKRAAGSMPVRATRAAVEQGVRFGRKMGEVAEGVRARFEGEQERLWSEWERASAARREEEGSAPKAPPRSAFGRAVRAYTEAMEAGTAREGMGFREVVQTFGERFRSAGERVRSVSEKLQRALSRGEVSEDLAVESFQAQLAERVERWRTASSRRRDDRQAFIEQLREMATRSEQALGQAQRTRRQTMKDVERATRPGELSQRPDEASNLDLARRAGEVAYEQAAAEGLAEAEARAAGERAYREALAAARSEAEKRAATLAAEQSAKPETQLGENLTNPIRTIEKLDRAAARIAEMASPENAQALQREIARARRLLSRAEQLGSTVRTEELEAAIGTLRWELDNIDPALAVKVEADAVAALEKRVSIAKYEELRDYAKGEGIEIPYSATKREVLKAIRDAGEMHEAQLAEYVNQRALGADHETARSLMRKALGIEEPAKPEEPTAPQETPTPVQETPTQDPAATEFKAGDKVQVKGKGPIYTIERIFEVTDKKKGKRLRAMLNVEDGFVQPHDLANLRPAVEAPPKKAPRAKKAPATPLPETPLRNEDTPKPEQTIPVTDKQTEEIIKSLGEKREGAPSLKGGVPAQEPVPGWIVRSDFEAPYPTYETAGKFRGGARRAISIDGAKGSWSRWLAGLRELSTADRTELFHRARLQAEGFPTSQAQIRDEADGWRAAESGAQAYMTNYEEVRQKWLADARERFGALADVAVSAVAKTHTWVGKTKRGKPTQNADDLRDFVAVTLHGADAGLNMRQTWVNFADRLSRPAGSRNALHEAQRYHQADEVMRAALLEANVLSRPEWARIERADQVFGMDSPSATRKEASLTEWIEKGWEVRYRSARYPWQRVWASHERDMTGGDVGDSGKAPIDPQTEEQMRALLAYQRLPGTLEGDRRAGGGIGKMAEATFAMEPERARRVALEKLEIELKTAKAEIRKMEKMDPGKVDEAYLAEVKSQAKVAEDAIAQLKAEAKGAVMPGQQRFADRLVELGLAEKVAAEHHYTLTKRGQELIDDLDRWLMRTDQGTIRLREDHPWWSARSAEWHIRCLSPCGESDGIQKVVEKGGELGLREGDQLGAVWSMMGSPLRWMKRVGSQGREALKSSNIVDATLGELTDTSPQVREEVGHQLVEAAKAVFSPLRDLPGGKEIELAAQEETVELSSMMARMTRRIADVVGEAELERYDVLAGEAEGEKWIADAIDLVETWGDPLKREKIEAARSTREGQLAEAIVDSLSEYREKLAGHVLRPLERAVRLAKARNVGITEVTGADLAKSLRQIGRAYTNDDEGRGEYVPLAWNARLIEPLAKQYGTWEYLMEVKSRLNPGEQETVELMDSVWVTVNGWGLQDYFPHVWARRSPSMYADQALVAAAGDVTPAEGYDGTVTTQGRLRIAEYLSSSEVVPNYQRTKVARNLWKREQNREGYIKHPVALMLYMRETTKKMIYERVMERGEELMLGRYERAQSENAADYLKELMENGVPDIRQSHSARAGHTIGENAMLEAPYGVRTFKGGKVDREFPSGQKFWLVKGYSHMASEEGFANPKKKVADQDGFKFDVTEIIANGELPDGRALSELTPQERAEIFGDVLALLPAGQPNTPSNYVFLRGTGIPAARLRMRKGGIYQGLNGPVTNTQLWTRLEELARDGAPKDMKRCRNIFCRVFEASASMLSGMAHHAALGGILNAPAAAMNFIEGVTVLGGASGGLKSIKDSYSYTRSFFGTVLPRTRQYWRLAAQGISHKDIYAEMAREALAKDSGNKWARDYLEIVHRSPYDIGGMHEKDQWANAMRNEGVAEAREEKPWQRKVRELSEGTSSFVQRHLNPKSFFSFELTEQFARQTQYITAYRDALARFGRGAGKGGAPYRNDKTGESWIVVDGNEMKEWRELRAGTPSDPHRISAHAIAWNQVARTHFIYRLAYHPAIMRTGVWRLAGHLGTFSTLMMVERFKDLRSLSKLAIGRAGKQDYPFIARGVRHALLGFALYELFEQVFGLDVGNMIGTHPSDLPVVADVAPELAYGAPNWVRFLPGGLPGGVHTMPMRLATGIASVAAKTAKGAFREGALGPAETFGAEFDDWRSHNSSFLLPFEDPMLAAGMAPLTIPLSRSLGGRLLELTTVQRSGDPERPLAYGSPIAPRMLDYPTAVARVFLPGTPSSWTESFRTARYRQAETESLRATRDSLAVRYFRAEDAGNEADMRQVLWDAEKIGLGDFSDSLKQRARSHGYSHAVRAYAGSDPLPVKLRRAIEDAPRLTTIERAKVHELIWGTSTPLGEINWRKAREYQNAPRWRELVDQYRSSFTR